MPDASVTTQTSGSQANQSQSQQSQQQQQAQQSTFSPEQLALQQLAGGTGGQALATGQLPGNYGVSSQAFDVMNKNFQQNIAPMLASQFGAGSSVIGSTFANMNEQLAAQQGQQQFSNFNNLFNDIANFATRPQGQTGTAGANSQANGSANFNYNQSNTTNATLGDMLMNPMMNKLGALGGGAIGSLFGGP